MTDLSTLPLPQSVVELSFEEILAQIKTDLLALDPTLEETLAIESDPIVKLLEAFAMRELYLRQDINDGIKATMITHAIGADLDNLLALLGVARQEVTPADATTTPPTEAVMESDTDFRVRGLLVLESFSTAGPKQGYIYHALSVSPDVHDVVASSPANGVVNVVVMSQDGEASNELLTAVVDKLNDDQIRPLGTELTVASATAVDYEIEATISVASEPEQSIALTAAKAAIDVYVVDQFKLGKSVQLSAIYAALHQANVEAVNIIKPTADVVIANDQFAHCVSINIVLS